MKTKPLYAILFATVLLSVSACRKKHDHICNCEFKNGGSAPKTYYDDVSREQAETQCANMQESMNTYVTDSALVVNCNLE